MKGRIPDDEQSPKQPPKEIPSEFEDSSDEEDDTTPLKRKGKVKRHVPRTETQIAYEQAQARVEERKNHLAATRAAKAIVPKHPPPQIMEQASNSDIAEHVFPQRNHYTSFKASKGTWNVDAESKYVPLALRATVNCSDLRLRTPLHVAANDVEIEMVQGLLTLGASSQLKNSTGGTTLFDATRNGHVDICQMLLTSGADMFLLSIYALAIRNY
ncbi:hypothetical protein L7F22_026885 [Adiantum nelumboides]|nr:hypothetical protein [Adiantum nelumboides]